MITAKEAIQRTKGARTVNKYMSDIDRSIKNAADNGEYKTSVAFTGDEFNAEVITKKLEILGYSVSVDIETDYCCKILKLGERKFIVRLNIDWQLPKFLEEE